nr:hypothetical protein CFP56_16537 [Quercus suber]
MLRPFAQSVMRNMHAQVDSLEQECSHAQRRMNTVKRDIYSESMPYFLQSPRTDISIRHTDRYLVPRAFACRDLDRPREQPKLTPELRPVSRNGLWERGDEKSPERSQ